MLTRRDLRIKAFQAVYAYKQRVKSNVGLAINTIDDYFAPDLNSLQAQDHQLLKKKAEVAKALFEETRVNPDALKKEDDAAILESINIAQDFLAKRNLVEKEEIKKLIQKDLLKVEEAFISALKFIEELSTINAKKEGEWIPNNLANNSFIKVLKESNQFQSLVAKYSINWNDEEQLPRFVYLEKLLHLEVIEEMNKQVETTSQFDFKVLKKLLKKGLFKVEAVNTVFDEKDTYWVDNEDIVEKNIARLIRTYQSEGLKLNLLEGEHWEEDQAFFNQLFDYGTEFGSEVEQVYLSNLKNRDREKLTDSDDVIVTLALNEMAHFSSIPLKVTMNEYIDIAKTYSTPKSNIFVNGLIDSTAKVLQEKGLIKKSGRGLLDNQ
ncbi:hypothetical protein OAH12_00560 [Cyclobacteriaceae bacterium]|nr:hypothetical protein [Cyclobacteriaceae bacterium]